MSTNNEFYDAVIIGSGFGGSVMAYRLAEAGLRVCLLERGKAYAPTSFPRNPYDLGKNFWDPSSGLYGLFDIWSFKRSGALVSSGLGGGSLIYANIHLRKDPKWFKEDRPDGGYDLWPISYDQLEPHYERVEKMMNVQKYPLNHPPYNQTPKTIAMQEAARNIQLGDIQLTIGCLLILPLASERNRSPILMMTIRQIRRSQALRFMKNFRTTIQLR